MYSLIFLELIHSSGRFDLLDKTEHSRRRRPKSNHMTWKIRISPARIVFAVTSSNAAKNTQTSSMRSSNGITMPTRTAKFSRVETMEPNLQCSSNKLQHKILIRRRVIPSIQNDQ